ncbi:MAG: MFS transporter [Demequinaceae bacterium]|nr:MFS transporter [Demequinaceae bacterium]
MFDRYRDILSRPGAAAFAFSGLLSRLPGAMFNISLFLMVQIQYDSYEMAGRVIAIGTLAWAAQTVPTARLVDRLGQRTGMIPLVGLHVTGVTIAITTAMLRGPEVWLWVAAVLASLSGPLGSLTRARWSHILTSDQEIHTAFSLEGVLDEILYMGGPALSAILATQIYPPLGLLVGTSALLVGISILLSQTATEPPPRRDEGVGLGFKIPKIVIAVTVIAFALGTLFGTIDVSTVKLAEEQGVKWAAGIILAMLSFGSFLGGLFYGSRTWKASLERRLVAGSLLAAIGFWAMALMPNLGLFALCGFFAGATIAPIIASSDNAIQRSVKKAQLTEGLAWLRIGIGIGVAIGAWVAGALIERSGAHGGLAFTGVAAVFVAIAALAVSPWLGHRLGKRTPPADVYVEPPPAQPAI